MEMLRVLIRLGKEEDEWDEVLGEVCGGELKGVAGKLDGEAGKLDKEVDGRHGEMEGERKEGVEGELDEEGGRTNNEGGKLAEDEVEVGLNDCWERREPSWATAAQASLKETQKLYNHAIKKRMEIAQKMTLIVEQEKALAAQEKAERIQRKIAESDAMSSVATESSLAATTSAATESQPTIKELIEEADQELKLKNVGGYHDLNNNNDNTNNSSNNTLPPPKSKKSKQQNRPTSNHSGSKTPALKPAKTSSNAREPPPKII